MGIFSKDAYKNAGIDESVFIECKIEPGLEAAYTIVAESETNWNALMEATGVDELNYFEEYGEELPYNEAAGTGFFSKLIAFFKNILQKVLGLFKKFIAMFDSVTKSNKDFLNKYKKAILGATLPDKFKYKGFKFTINDGKGNGNKINIENVPNDYSGWRDMSDIGNMTADTASAAYESKNVKDIDWEDLDDSIRGAIVGDSNGMSASEFTKELFSLYRNGESSKEVFDEVSTGDIITVLSTADKAKKAAENSFKTIKKSIESCIKALNKCANKFTKEATSDNSEKSSKGISFINAVSRFNKDYLASAQIANGALLTAIKAEAMQAKSLASTCVRYYHESVDLGDGEPVSESAIDGLDFI